MTKVYFMRHIQPKHDWENDRTRPLIEERKKDSTIVLEFLKNKKIEAFYCSPYKRSTDTTALSEVERSFYEIESAKTGWGSSYFAKAI